MNRRLLSLSFFSSVVLWAVLSHSALANGANNNNPWNIEPDSPVQYQFQYGEPPQAKGLWIDGGMGLGASTRYLGSSKAWGLNARYGQHYFATVVTMVRSFKFTTVKFKPGKTRETKQTVRNVSFLYGRIREHDWGFTTTAFGLASIHGRNDSGNLTTFGIPFQIQAVWTPWTYIGFGAKAFVTFAGRLKETNFGGLLEINLGRFK